MGIVKRREVDEFERPTREKYEAEGNPYYSTARLWDDEDMRALRMMTDRAHEHGAMCLVKANGNLHEAVALAQKAAIYHAPKNAWGCWPAPLFRT